MLVTNFLLNSKLGIANMEPKLFAALLNGVLRRVFENDQSITPELLKEQVFQDTDISIDGSSVFLLRSSKF